MSVDADAHPGAEHRAASSDEDAGDESREERGDFAALEADDLFAHDLPFVSCAAETTPPRCLSSVYRTCRDALGRGRPAPALRKSSRWHLANITPPQVIGALECHEEIQQFVPMPKIGCTRGTQFIFPYRICGAEENKKAPYL